MDKLIKKWENKLRSLTHKRIFETNFELKNIYAEQEQLIEAFLKDLENAKH
jgi:hypothetical protein